MARPVISKTKRVLMFLGGVALAFFALPFLVYAINTDSVGWAFVVFILAPASLMIWYSIAAQRIEGRLRQRAKGLPAMPEGLEVISRNATLDESIMRLPIFQRPMAMLWSTVVRLRCQGQEISVFEMIHADWYGEGKDLGQEAGIDRIYVTCAVGMVEADMPLVTVTPRESTWVSMSRGLVDWRTESDEFNAAFRLRGDDQYALSSIIDARTIEAIVELDRHFGVQLAGRCVLVYSRRLDPKGSQRLVSQTARLMGTFPRVVESLFPESPKSLDHPHGEI
jgi:hypothetical protein